MVTGILGRKLGMTQIFLPDGTAVPATVVKAGPCVVVQAKTAATDGYEAVQLGLVDERAAAADKPTTGHFKKAGVPPTRIRREVGMAPGGEPVKAGDAVLVNMFTVGERVDVVANGRGKGFQGVMKRHGFSGGAATHGSMFHRAPGSIGASSYPSRVIKGMRAAGRMAPRAGWCLCVARWPRRRIRSRSLRRPRRARPAPRSRPGEVLRPG